MKAGKLKATSDYGPQKITATMWILLILIIISGFLIPMFLSSDSNIIARVSLRKYQEGQLCPENVFATTSFKFIDTESTKEQQEKAEASVLPSFSYSLNNTLRSTDRIDRFAEAWNSPSTAVGVINQMLQEEGLDDALQVTDRYAELNVMDRNQLILASKETMQLVLSMGIYRADDLALVKSQGSTYLSLCGLPTDNNSGLDNKTVNIDSVVTKETLEKNISDWLNSYTKSIKGFQVVLLEDTIKLLASENMIYDDAKTTLDKQKAMNNTPSVLVTVTKGQIILQKDTVITKGQIELLEELAKHRTVYTIPEMIGRVVFLVIVSLVFLLVFLSFINQEHRKYQYLMFTMVMMLLCQIGTYFLYKWAQSSAYDFHEAIVPFIVAPVFISLVSGKKRLGAVTSFLVSSYVMLLPGSTTMSFFLCVAISCICVFFFQYPRRKVDNLFHWLYACISAMFVDIAFSMLLGSSIAELLPSLGALIANITLSLFVANLFLSIFETVMNLPTPNRLNELAFNESPVLQRLSQAAQGTYNHSMNVSEMAYECGKAIHANALLCRVGGLYHDIGKADYPEYFVENQGEENKQDDIKPTLSVAIIKSHVKTGIEKGRDAGLPQEILDIIGSHHGNDVIAFFYRKALDLAGDNADNVEKSDFRYDGKVPDSKEAAIVMLCDCVEAASRTVKRPSPTRYEKLIHSIIMGKMERDQMAESNLSMTDISVIAKTLTNALVAKNHHRIEYPSDNKDSTPAPQGEEEKPAETKQEEGNA